MVGADGLDSLRALEIRSTMCPILRRLRLLRTKLACLSSWT